MSHHLVGLIFHWPPCSTILALTSCFLTTGTTVGYVSTFPASILSTAPFNFVSLKMAASKGTADITFKVWNSAGCRSA